MEVAFPHSHGTYPPIAPIIIVLATWRRECIMQFVFLWRAWSDLSLTAFSLELNMVALATWWKKCIVQCLGNTTKGGSHMTRSWRLRVLSRLMRGPVAIAHAIQLMVMSSILFCCCWDEGQVGTQRFVFNLNDVRATWRINHVWQFIW